MTYNKKQKLCGWSEFITDGKFIWCDTIREGLEDVTYFVIEREINGKKVRYIERTKTRIITDAKNAFLVDCGLEAEFKQEVSEISGLEPLEGREIIANAQGGIVRGLIVTNGKITLPNPVKKIIVGLPYEFLIETLNFEGENTQGLKKVINYISAKIHQSREDFFFIGQDDKAYQNVRNIESINNSSKLFSKDVNSTLVASAVTDATVKISQPYPLPLTILSISATIDVQDNENS
ncbi:hypothetical protein IJ531_03470 [bacterium]|nr:hypothetical protein [bacterium]